LLGTLAKVAIGIAVAKGVGGMMKNAGGAQKAPSGPSGGSGGGLGDLLGQLAGGKSGGTAGGAQSGGGLGDILAQLGKGAQSGGASQRQADDIMPPGYDGSNSGGLGDLLGGLAGRAPQTRSSGGSLGDLLNTSISNGGEPDVMPSSNEEMMAGLLLRAMVQATKADGELDDKERAKLTEHLEDASDEERAFVNAEFSAPMDVEGLARQVPAGMEQQVYAMSVLVIDLDHEAEAQYLHQLASAMGLQQDVVNNIHDQVGAQRLYS